MDIIIKRVIKNDLECQEIYLELEKTPKPQEGTSLSVDLSLSLFDKISLEFLQSIFKIIKSFKLLKLNLSFTHISEIPRTTAEEIPDSFEEICDLIQTSQTATLTFDNNQNLEKLSFPQIARLSKAFQACQATTLSLQSCCLNKLEVPQQTLLFSGLSNSKISTICLDDNELTPEQIETFSSNKSYCGARPLLFEFLGAPAQHVCEYLGIKFSIAEQEMAVPTKS